MKRQAYIFIWLLALMTFCRSGGVMSEEAASGKDAEPASLALLNVLDSEDIAALRSAEANFQQRDWKEGMAKLVPIFSRKPDMLIPSGDGHTFVSVWEYFHNRIIALPPPATEVYRSEEGDTARRLERARADLDIAAIREIARDSLFTESGRAALRFLIERYYEGRQFAEALSCVSRFEKYLAFDPRDSVEIAAMKLLCLARTGRADDFETAALQIVAGLPNEEIQWHGERMSLADFAARLAAVARAVERRDGAGPLLGRESEAAILPRAASAYDAGTYPAEESQSPDILPDWQAEATFVDVCPVLSGGTLYIRLRSSLFALDVDNLARPRWKKFFPENVAGVSLGGGKSRLAAVYSAAESDGRVFTTFDDDGIIRLICLDAQSGRQLWIAGKKGEDIIDSAHVLSPPACIGGSVYVTAVKSQGARGNDYYLVRLNAEDGRTVCSTFLCTRIGHAAGGEVLYPPAPAVISDGTVYVATNAGAVCAVDATSGRLRWTTLYDQFNSVVKSGRNRFERAVRRDVSFAYGAPAAHRGVLAVAPPEADCLIALDAENGRTLWRLDNSCREYSHLLGARKGVIILSGSKIAALEARTGRRLWASEPDLGAAVSGMGFMSGDLLMLPADDMLTAIDSRTGRVVSRCGVNDLLRQPPSARIPGLVGNLLNAGDRIISVSRSRIVVYPVKKFEEGPGKIEQGKP